MDRRNPAQRRYIARFMPAMFGYVAVLFATTWAIRQYAPQGLALWLLSVAPALPLVAVIAIMGMYLAEERDEYIRTRLSNAMIGGIGVTLVVTTVWGFLENGGAAPHFPTYLTFPLWCGSFGLVQCVHSLRDRAAGQAS